MAHGLAAFVCVCRAWCFIWCLLVLAHGFAILAHGFAALAQGFAAWAHGLAASAAKLGTADRVNKVVPRRATEANFLKVMKISSV